MVMRVLEELGRGGAGKVDLWVDVARESARELYRSCGFEDREVVKDYYGQGRDAARMVIDLGL